MKRQGIKSRIAVIAVLTVLLIILPVFRADARTVKMTGKTIVLQKGESISLQLKGLQTVAAWSSDKERIVCVDAKGNITAKRTGTVMITARTPEGTYRCRVVVEHFRLNRTSLQMEPARIGRLKVKGCKHPVKWKSKNKEIAVVNENGMVRAIKEGQTGIYAVVHGKKLFCKVTVKKCDSIVDPFVNIVKKPVIYLYPQKTQNVSVTLTEPDRLIFSYPDYRDKWQVSAKPDGTLKDSRTGRELYSLYYESAAKNPCRMEEEGFVVKGEDITSFLEEKLAILGLSEKEAEEFIIYYLPILGQNPYNYIRFASEEEIDANMSLDIVPKPDSLIRVCMFYKGLKQPVNVTPQKLETPERCGFCVVEWGGVEIP
ncbi:MAG: hypothetical protein E7294_09010 [Lachnospiraceae bacterium]|nr:hypothetical protein [Lachnospiraceae bacterium]